MLAHRSGSRGGATRRGTTSQDENASVHQRLSSKGLDNENTAANQPLVVKTPARALNKRRALGDISNRKPSARTENAASANKPVLPTTTPRRPVASFVVPKTSNTAIGPSTKKVSFTLPTKQRGAKEEQSVKHAKKVSTPKIRTVPDVERPAGRLWMDEPDDYDEDMPIVEEVRRFKKELEVLETEQLRQHREWQLQQYKEADDRLTQQVQEMLDEMDDLADGMDDLLVEDEEEIVSLGLDGLSSDDDSLFNLDGIAI